MPQSYTDSGRLLVKLADLGARSDVSQGGLLPAGTGIVGAVVNGVVQTILS